ncbi:hypothetical protein [Streptomyces malaysiensis]|uniref:Uncharacterized protein n=1 Tax=Streptomyces malaysiensis TaxID=92644 RepID=A0A7X5X7K7_STRMQ|nr:hypothetical protein [Streptomyces malaysiensis]NIY68119.1 hypothetical protein [Streptomyces malaysiensis]
MEPATEVTEADVYEFMGGIPAQLKECAAAKHEWRSHDWTGYNANGRVVRNPLNAVALDVVQLCKPCGQKRHFTLTVRGRRVIDRSDFTYSDRNPHLVSPQGVSETGISVRREMAMHNEYEAILAEPVPLRSTKRTRRAQGAA